jgi:signal transduction histidine kinase
VDGAAQRLIVTLPDKPLIVNADPQRVAQILSNLLSNASKFTPAGGEISLSVRRQDGEVVVVVTDTGIGVPQEMLDRIFEMFAQVERNQSNAGLGIGLTLAKSLIELHGGKR